MTALRVWIVACLVSASVISVAIGVPLVIPLVWGGAGLGWAIGLSTRVNRIRLAAVLFIVPGIVEVLGLLPTLGYIARNGELPTSPIGAQSLEPVVDLGIEAVGALAWLWAGTGALEVVAAILLWRMRRWGGVLAAILFAPGLCAWVGFGLPFWLIGGAARMALVDRGWKELS
jgi:hypothetical protein